MAFNLDAGNGGRRIGTSLAEINIVPLVDVVLVLLLIFMLTAPMMYRGIDVNLPRSASRPTAVEERMVLTVTRDKRLFLNDREVALATLDTTLRSAFESRTDKTLYLKADAALPYGDVVDTMDRVRRAGIEKLGMLTEPAREH
jgi:biopolymer transport protein TolR